MTFALNPNIHIHGALAYMGLNNALNLLCLMISL